MRTIWPLLLVWLSAWAGHAADLCNPANMTGPYAFQLTGSTNISGTPKPAAALGRIVLDGKGSLSGTASVTFRGLLLGNPVTGTYEAKDDCSVTWKLQDDSGAFQNFSGTFSSDGTRVRFKQTDPGGAQQGIMEKLSDACSAADLSKEYNFTVSGSTTPMEAGEVRHTVSFKGALDVAENGSFQAASDCSVSFVLVLPPAPNAQAGEATRISIRGFLVQGGKEILAFQTDPGAVVTTRLTSDGK